MNTVSLFLSMTLILIIFYTVTRKKNNLLVHIFVLMAIEFLFTSFISVIADNESLWKISKDPPHFLMFRVAEVLIFPLLLLWYLELNRMLGTFSKKLLLYLTWTFLLAGFERALSFLDIMEYTKWELWASFLSWALFLAVTILLGKIFSSILRKEGIEP